MDVYVTPQNLRVLLTNREPVEFLLLRLFHMQKLFPSVGTKVVKHYTTVEVHRSSPQGVVF